MNDACKVVIVLGMFGLSGFIGSQLIEFVKVATHNGVIMACGVMGLAMVFGGAISIYHICVEA